MPSSEHPMLYSTNPATGEIVWQGEVSSPATIDRKVRNADLAWKDWYARPFTQRETVLMRYAELLLKHEQDLVSCIGTETGKPLWEARTEVKAMHGKIAISIEAHRKRCAEFSGGTAITRFRPHGVVAVLGPYNFPGHLPNGHIAPALLAGNAVVFKPSEWTPSMADWMQKLWFEAGLPEPLFQVVQGGAQQGTQLCEHPVIKGIFFTGSERVGRKLEVIVSKRPGTMLALEMGGNNPLVIGKLSAMEPSVLLAVQSAFLSAGQRCTCARRIIIPKGSFGDAWVANFLTKIRSIRVGHWNAEPQPFMGCLVSAQAADRVLEAQQDWIAKGAQPLELCRRLPAGDAFLSPGLIDVTGVAERPDEEIFGPLPQLIRVPDFAAAVHEAAATGYGLAAGLFSEDRAEYEFFSREMRAGIINWNQQLTGASSAAPFGGVGRSGNFRPSAYFAADYCSYPVASMEADAPSMPASLPPGLVMESD
ncbi:MAG: succinylglutamate-semialdehyde dehydrogenase [Verrucomicrobia bacterium]|nr:succinylglutamate-semialdehyde dehydrogenase [Verrucomicrobiota bacterium]